MKRIISVILCFVLLGTSFSCVYADDSITATEPAEEIFPLSQLGVLDTTEPESIVTKGTLARGLDVIMGSGASLKYFDGQDLEMPLTYGQAIMVFIDVLGYTPYMDMYRYDASKPSGYIQLAKRIDLINKIESNANKQLTVNEYSKLLYDALMTVPCVSIEGIVNGSFIYNTDKNVTLLTGYMKLTKIRGVVSGVDGVSLDSRDGANNEGVKIAGKWYRDSIDTDMFGLFGRYCEAFVDEETNELKCVYELKYENEIISIASDDINPSRTTLQNISYYTEKGKLKDAKLSKEFDVIYNRELLTDPKKADLVVSNADMLLIDNDDDGKMDVVIIEKFKSYIVFAVSIASNRIVDTYGNNYDLEKYFDDGYVLYGVYGKPVDLNTPVRYDVISYLEGKSGNVTYMQLCDKQVSGVIDSSEDNFKYITIDDVEYECSQDYLANRSSRDTVKLGDRVTAFFDCKGRIIDIKYVSGTEKAAYLMAVAPKIFGDYQIKILDLDGVIKVLEVPSKITLDGVKQSTDTAFNKDIFKKSGSFKPQLILYRSNSKGEVVYIDTAREVNKIGSRNNDGFTLDYDYEVNGTPRALIMNGELIVASKYVATMNTTTVFGVVTNSEEDCYVQAGTAFNSGSVLPVSTDLKVKIYNVNQNYEAQYIVYEQSIDEGGWVDYWGDPYILDETSYKLNEDGDVVLCLRVYNPKGKLYEKYVENYELKTQVYNSMSGDNRFYDIAVKDLPKGTVLFFNEDFGGVRSISVQHMPMADKSELIFEKITSASGSDGNYGINERTYNGKYLMSYGEVVARIEAGIVVNNHLPTEDEIANGAVFPMEEWNRIIPLVSSDVVFLYDRSRDILTIESADCILPGDMVFVKRSAATYNGVYIYRD